MSERKPPLEISDEERHLPLGKIRREVQLIQSGGLRCASCGDIGTVRAGNLVSFVALCTYCYELRRRERMRGRF